MSTGSHAHPGAGMASAGASHQHEHEEGVDPGTGHVHPQVITKPPAVVTQELIAATERSGALYKNAVIISGLLLVVGVIGFIWQAMANGFTTFSPWAYLMATYAFLLTTASSAPMLSIGQRMLRSHWRRPLSRASELFAVVGILSTLMFIPLLMLLPSTGHLDEVSKVGPCVPAIGALSNGTTCVVIDRVSIWWGFPYTPFLPDILAIVALAVLGIFFLLVCSLPDMAMYRPHTMGFRRWMLDRLIFVNWKGTDRQWKVQRLAIVALGSAYFFQLCLVHSVVISDFGMALIPKWVDSIQPATQTVNGFQAAIASTLIASYLMHRLGGYRDYIAVDQFWSASKLLLALSLLWFYFWFSGFIIYWYGRQPGEIGVLGTLVAHSYRTPFVLALIFSFLAPFLILVWNMVRKSLLGPTVVSVIILFGVMFDKVRIYVASFQSADIHNAALHTPHPEPIAVADLPLPLIPGAADIMMVLGGLGGAIFLYLIAAKIIPPVSIWMVQEGMLYRKRVRYLKTHVLLMGKPE